MISNEEYQHKIRCLLDRMPDSLHHNFHTDGGTITKPKLAEWMAAGIVYYGGDVDPCMWHRMNICNKLWSIYNAVASE